MSKFYYNDEQALYDAIVVGTGISGGWATKELSENGLQTLMLERGRMGRNLKTSVLNGFNQVHTVPNVFVTDGSFMALASCANPSLTYNGKGSGPCNKRA